MMRLLDAEDLATAGPPETMRCRTCGSTNVIYDTNPHGYPPLRTKDGTPIRCSFGVEMTGEPGAERCNDCGSLDVETVAAP